MSRPATPDLSRRMLDAAREILLEVGYPQLSMRRVAKRVNCSPTAIYLHYASKDDLMHALVDEGMQRLRQQLEAGLADGGETPASRMEALCRAYVAFGRTHREYYEIMFLLNDRTVARYPAESYRRARENLGLFGQVCAEAGAVTKPEELLILATSIWSALHGTVALLLAGRVDRGIDAERLVDEAVAMAVTRVSGSPG
jgi:AcrR family transcriptional regulator